VKRLPGLADYAAVLLPADPSVRAEVLEADARWIVRPQHTTADVVLWGRIPYRSMLPARQMGAHVIARERALLSLARRGAAGLSVAALHRLSPPPGPPGAIAGAARRFMLGGAVVEMCRTGRPPRVADAVAAAAGVQLVERSLELGSDQAAVARAHAGEGQTRILRLAPAGVAPDPAAAADALERLEAAGVPAVPRLLGRGSVAGANWALESVLPGRRPRRLTRSLAKEVVTLCAALPVADGPPSALGEELTILGELLPDHATSFERAKASFSSAEEPSFAVLRHGDLWPGNLLVHRARLAGVIDWDTWHPSSLPGIDVLHLFAAEERRRARLTFGRLWMQRPWRSERFTEFAVPYWSRFGSPSRELLDVIGVAWWTCWAAQALRRHPRLLQEPGWLRENVDPVVEAWER
jgi:Phosphotransferase enzyme family